jgi:COP9 signalosome complex subunit 3
MTYVDNLIYHYAGGIALAALKMWSKAEEFFEICVTSPGITPSAIQLEALKKMRLVQLIAKGKTETLPKYALQHLNRLFKGTVYSAFVNAYPHDVDALKDIVKKDRALFAAVSAPFSLSQNLNLACTGEESWPHQSSD